MAIAMVCGEAEPLDGLCGVLGHAFAIAIEQALAEEALRLHMALLGEGAELGQRGGIGDCGRRGCGR